MDYPRLESVTFLNNILLSLIGVMSVTIIYRLFTYDIFPIVMNSIFLLLLFTLYFVHKKYLSTLVIS
ncbi:MAG: hypothetical protein RPR97_19685, partial [Colwellia sp.]